MSGSDLLQPLVVHNETATPETIFEQEESNHAFYMASLMSVAAFGVGAALLWTAPFAASTTVGVSLVSHVLGIWVPSPLSHKPNRKPKNQTH